MGGDGGAVGGGARARWGGAAAAAGAVAAMAGLGDLGDAVPAYLALHGIAAAGWAVFGVSAVLGPPSRRPRIALAAVLLLGLGARLALVPGPPDLSDDVWRYLWEGRIGVAGFSPYAHPPADAVLAPLRDPDWHRVAHRDVSTIYPPAAQLLFRAVATLAPSVTGFQVAAVAADAALALVLAAALSRRGLPFERVGLYWLCPLAMVEVARGAHVEPFALLAMAGGLALLDSGRFAAAAVAAAVGAGVKVFPAVLLPLVLRGAGTARGRAASIAAFGIALALPTMPFARDGAALLRGGATYGGRWEFNSCAFALLRPLLGGEGARLAVAGAFAGLLGSLLVRSRDPARACAALGLGFVLLSPTVHPWYGLWAVAWLPLVPSPAAGLVGALLPLSYVVLVGYSPGDAASWSLPTWVPWVEYAPVVAALLVALAARGRALAGAGDIASATDRAAR